MDRIRVYLKREPTTDTYMGKRLEGKYDVVASRMPNGETWARWMWWHKGKPTKRTRTVILNCAKWDAVWL